MRMNINRWYIVKKHMIYGLIWRIARPPIAATAAQCNQPCAAADSLLSAPCLPPYKPSHPSMYGRMTDATVNYWHWPRKNPCVCTSASSSSSTFFFFFFLSSSTSFFFSSLFSSLSYLILLISWYLLSYMLYRLVCALLILTIIGFIYIIYTDHKCMWYWPWLIDTLCNQTGQKKEINLLNQFASINSLQRQIKMKIKKKRNNNRMIIKWVKKIRNNTFRFDEYFFFFFSFT